MANTTTALVFVMFLNLIMFVAQLSMDNTADRPNTLYNYNGSTMSKYDQGYKTYQLDTTDINNTFPKTSNLVEVTDGNFLTDTLSSIGSWIFGLPGLKYVYMMVSAPYTMVKYALPQSLEPIAFAFGVFWNVISVFLIIAFFWGRE